MEPIIGTFSYLCIHDLVVTWVHLKVNSLLFNWEDFLMESAKLYPKIGLDVDRIDAYNFSMQQIICFDITYYKCRSHNALCIKARLFCLLTRWKHYLRMQIKVCDWKDELKKRLFTPSICCIFENIIYHSDAPVKGRYSKMSTKLKHPATYYGRTVKTLQVTSDLCPISTLYLQLWVEL